MSIDSRMPATGLAKGFALAADVVEGQATYTSDEGLIAGEIDIDADDRLIPGYRAQPSSRGPHPVMLVVQEIFGVHEHIRDLCRRYAHQGFYAIAPELFIRQGDVARMRDMSEIFTTVVPRVPDEQVMADLDATLAHAAASGQADVNRASVIGFCWGGRMVWLYAAHNTQLCAGIAYYGRVSGMTSPIKPRDPVDIAATLRVPVLGLYSANDPGISLESIEQMRAQLSTGASGSQILLFPGTTHGFNADYRPSYNAAAAQYAARLAQDWLRDHLGGAVA